MDTSHSHTFLAAIYELLAPQVACLKLCMFWLPPRGRPRAHGDRIALEEGLVVLPTALEDPAHLCDICENIQDKTLPPLRCQPLLHRIATNRRSAIVGDGLNALLPERSNVLACFENIFQNVLRVSRTVLIGYHRFRTDRTLPKFGARVLRRVW